MLRSAATPNRTECAIESRNEANHNPTDFTDTHRAGPPPLRSGRHENFHGN
jgi:hypothetical protein